MTEYDPGLIQKYADKLNVQADVAIIYGVLKGFIGGAFIGVVLKYFLLVPSFFISKKEIDSLVDPIVICVLVFTTVYGYFKGQQKAFLLRLQSQLALCQMKIEENTQKK